MHPDILASRNYVARAKIARAAEVLSRRGGDSAAIADRIINPTVPIRERDSYDLHQLEAVADLLEIHVSDPGSPTKHTTTTVERSNLDAILLFIKNGYADEEYLAIAEDDDLINDLGVDADGVAAIRALVPVAATEEADSAEDGESETEEPSEDPDAEEGQGEPTEEISEALVTAGFTNGDALSAATDAELLAVPGVGKATVAKIRETWPHKPGPE